MSEEIYDQKLEMFKHGMRNKAFKRYRERKMDGSEQRRIDPWNHDLGFLRGRLLEEFKEYLYADPMTEADELLDLANFCFYLWVKLEDV